MWKDSNEELERQPGENQRCRCWGRSWGNVELEAELEAELEVEQEAELEGGSQGMEKREEGIVIVTEFKGRNSCWRKNPHNSSENLHPCTYIKSNKMNIEHPFIILSFTVIPSFSFLLSLLSFSAHFFNRAVQVISSSWLWLVWRERWVILAR